MTNTERAYEREGQADKFAKCGKSQLLSEREQDIWVKQLGHCLDKWRGLVRTNVGLIQQEYVRRASAPA